MSSTSTKEEWAEIVEKVDGSDSLKLEAYRLKAMRKYSIVKGIPLESIDFEDIQNSPQGLEGWAEMSVSVPGIETALDEDATSAAAVTPTPTPKARAGGGKKRAGTAVTNDGEQPEEEEKNTKKRKPNAAGAAANRQQEKRSRELLCLLQRAEQVTSTICTNADNFPSQYSWAKPLLTEYRQLQDTYAELLQPDNGEDLTEFLNEFKLSVISPIALKAIKKNYKDNYFKMVTLFNDRCSGICEQTLA